jgi:hypothetical protein
MEGHWMAITINIPPSHLLKQDELLPSQTEGLVQDGHLQNVHASLLQALHGAYHPYGLIAK